MEPFRVLVIIWKWTNIPRHKTYSVEGDERAIVLCIHQKIKTPEIVTVISKAISGGLGKLSHYVILFHDKKGVLGSVRQEQIQKAIEEMGLSSFNIRFDKFSEGKDFIYHKPPPNDTGLLDESGDFGPHYYTSVDKPIYVYNTKTENILLKYFNPVWRFYTYRLKYYMFELKEQLVLILIGLDQNKKFTGPLQENLNAYSIFNPLKIPFQSALMFSPEEFRAIYSDLENVDNIENSYKELQTFLVTIPMSTPDYLKSTAEKFRAVLNLIPGEIY